MCNGWMFSIKTLIYQKIWDCITVISSNPIKQFVIPRREKGLGGLAPGNPPIRKRLLVASDRTRTKKDDFSKRNELVISEKS